MHHIFIVSPVAITNSLFSNRTLGSQVSLCISQYAHTLYVLFYFLSCDRPHYLRGRVGGVVRVVCC